MDIFRTFFLAFCLASMAAGSGGVIVHLGCGNGKKTVSLRKNSSCYVHGLEADADKVREARRTIRSRGLDTSVLVEVFDDSLLPYVDNMVNLLVADDPGKVSKAEILRVLAPGGRAVIRGKKITKPWPADIDQWTHYLHGPDNNPVARDRVVGPPPRYQWLGGPRWTRHHERMSSINGMVSARGRVYYIIDEGPTVSIMLPPVWTLVARDAFNGKILWKRKLGKWYVHYRRHKDGPADAPRRLIAAGGRVYVTLSLDGPVTCLDGATGGILRTYKNTKGAEEIIHARGKLYVLSGPGSIGDGGRKIRPVERRTIQAIDAKSGKTDWSHTDVVAAMTMAVDEDRMVYFNFEKKHIVCLDLQNGKKRWRSGSLPCPDVQASLFASRLIIKHGVVLFAGGDNNSGTELARDANRFSDTLTALSAKTGETLWASEHPPSGFASPEDLFVIDSTVWFSSTARGSLDGRVTGLDIFTGKIKSTFIPYAKTYFFHHRCHSGRATEKYLMTSRAGIEFVSVKSEKDHLMDLNHWVRGTCLYGFMPCNGLLYCPPHPCACYTESMLKGFNALAPASASEPVIKGFGPADRLEKGPAYNHEPAQAASAEDWPTYRGDNARRGFVKTDVPAKLRQAWKLNLGGRLSSVIAADGRAFVAAVDRHTVHAVDIETGKEIWRYQADGRVDSPPSYFQGRVLFGSRDGRVYCVRASDGALAWRFQAALSARKMMAHEQLESVWPVHGSVLVQDGIVHLVAGRSAFLDGGMRYYRLDAESGRLISSTVLDDTIPGTHLDLQKTVKWLNMAVGLPDILSCDNDRVYMRSQVFTLQGRRTVIGPERTGPEEGIRRPGEPVHLFCPNGFLDDTWFHRNYWIYGNRWCGGFKGYAKAGNNAPAGRILCAGDNGVYGFGRQNKYFKWTLPMEYQLFYSKREWAEDKNNYHWYYRSLPMLVRAMALTKKVLFIAGPRDVLEEEGLDEHYNAGREMLRKQADIFSGKEGALLQAVSAGDGSKLAEYPLEALPVFDGMAAARGRLFMADMKGNLVCFSKENEHHPRPDRSAAAR